MNRKWLVGSTFSILVLGSSLLYAQSRGVPFVGPGPGNDITFMGFQAGLGNQVVTGAPYSATVTSEFQQTLSDGNKIDRKTVTTVYRDSQGRTRREQTLPAIGQYSASTAPQAIFINDPVAGVSYVLDPAKMIARKMSMGPGPGRGGRGGPGPGRGGRGGPGGNAGSNPNPNVTTESLGTQNIEGILVQGTRVTRTVPAGAMGNQNPIHVASERWYSSQLQLNVLVKNDNPAGGLNTTALSNINTGEPNPTLFQVPSGYSIQDPPKRPGFRSGRGGPPPLPPAPAQ